jgi:hypothetical protein
MPSSSRTSSATLAAACARAHSGWHLADAAAQADGDKVVRAKVVQLLDNSPFIRKADTLTELAKKMEVDVAASFATIERYNVACKQGLEKEPEFGKPLKSAKPFDTRPVTPFRSSRSRARTSAAPRPTCNAACSTGTSNDRRTLRRPRGRRHGRWPHQPHSLPAHLVSVSVHASQV